MSGADFFHTNILIYAASEDDDKAIIANQLILNGGGVVSIQVLNEFANVASRKRRLPWPKIRDFLTGVRSAARVVPLDEATHDEALRLAARYKLAFYDALIVASALHADCSRVLTEDMHHGLMIDGQLRIENPFRA